MTYPNAIIYPAHPTNVLGPPNNPKGFVLHTPEEPADGYPATPYWFAQPHPDRAGSTTWFIATNGDVYECVPEDVAAIANGVYQKPYPVWADPNKSLNRQTVSVEIEGYAATIGQTLTVAQRASLVSLVRYACGKYGIPIDRQHIIGHYEVASNRSDPGTLPIEAIIAEAQEDDMKGIIVQSGDDFYMVGPGFRMYLGKTATGLQDMGWPVLQAGQAGAPATMARLFEIPDIKEYLAGAAAYSFLAELGLEKKP